MTKEQKKILISECPNWYLIGDMVRFFPKPSFKPFNPIIELDYDGFPKSPPVKFENWIIVNKDETYFYLERANP